MRFAAILIYEEDLKMGHPFHRSVTERTEPSRSSVAPARAPIDFADRCSKLESVIAALTGCLKVCEDFVLTIEDPFARARFQRDVKHLRNQLLVASFELARIDFASMRVTAGSPAEAQR